MAQGGVDRRCSRGSIEKLPSGAYRVRVYGGVDPVTGRRHDLRETVPPGPRAAREAEKVRTRLLAQVDEIATNPLTQVRPCDVRTRPRGCAVAFRASDSCLRHTPCTRVTQGIAPAMFGPRSFRLRECQRRHAASRTSLTQCESRGTAAPRRPIRKSKSAPLSACCTWFRYSQP